MTSDATRRRRKRSEVNAILNKLKWDEGTLDSTVVEFVSRGAPGDIARFHGVDIVEIGASFVTLEGGTMIPYHRVLKIVVGERVVFERPASTPP